VEFFAEIFQKIPLTMLLGTSFFILKSRYFWPQKLKIKKKKKNSTGRQQLNTYCRSS
jgi:hypothetical protein